MCQIRNAHLRCADDLWFCLSCNTLVMVLTSLPCSACDSLCTAHTRARCNRLFPLALCRDALDFVAIDHAVLGLKECRAIARRYGTRDTARNQLLEIYDNIVSKLCVCVCVAVVSRTSWSREQIQQSMVFCICGRWRCGIQMRTNDGGFAKVQRLEWNRRIQVGDDLPPANINQSINQQ
jgi:hypothetical protein